MVSVYFDVEKRKTSNGVTRDAPPPLRYILVCIFHTLLWKGKSKISMTLGCPSRVLRISGFKIQPVEELSELKSLLATSLAFGLIMLLPHCGI